MGKATKKIVITTLFALVAMAGKGQTFTWRIEGFVVNAAPTNTLMVINAEKRSTIATLQVKDGIILSRRIASGKGLDRKQTRHGQIVGDKIEGGTGKRLERPVLSV